MRVILTYKAEINSKKVGKLVMLHFLSPDTGKVGTLFISPEKYESYKLTPDHFLSAGALEAIAADATITDAQFDNNGQLVTLA